MRAAPPLQEVDLTGAKTNKGRFWWELRKRRALSQQAGLIEMQIARPRPRRATSRPLTSQPPRRAGLNGPIDARRRSPPRRARLPRGRLQPRSPPSRRGAQALRALVGVGIAVNHHHLLFVIPTALPPALRRRTEPSSHAGCPDFWPRNRKIHSAAEFKTNKQTEVPKFHSGG